VFLACFSWLPGLSDEWQEDEMKATGEVLAAQLLLGVGLCLLKEVEERERNKERRKIK